MKSSLFLNNVTVVDHAYITPFGNIEGGSVNPSFIISGEVEKHEQVVIDFSKCKKKIKALIDDNLIGFDHKLWVTPSSACTLKDVGNGRTMLESEFVKFVMPTERFKVVESSYTRYEDWPQWFAQFLQTELRKDYPTVTVECVANLDKSGFTYFPSQFAEAVAPFRYSHGLKNSSSWGCRNAGHGHLSYIQAFPSTPEVQGLIEKMAKTFNNAVFIFNENIESNDADTLRIKYFDEDWVEYVAEYAKDAPESLQVLYFLDRETTIENILDHIVHKYYDELIETGCEKLFISEGLWKGACWQR